MFTKAAPGASILIFILSAFLGSPADAQKSIADYESRWCNMLEHLRQFPEWEVRDSINKLLKSEMLAVLQTKESGRHTFPILSKKLGYRVSPDKKLRTFCWDEISGGTWHTYGIVAQFKTEKGEFKTQLLSDGREAELGEFTDSAPRKIYQIERKSTTHYLIIGYGTHGSGDHHETAQVFSVVGNELNRCEDCFKVGDKTTSYYHVQVKRIYTVDMRYDKDTKILDHNSYERNYEDLSDRKLDRRTALFFNGQYFAIK